jgi:hypothetical protein
MQIETRKKSGFFFPKTLMWRIVELFKSLMIINMVIKNIRGSLPFDPL